MNKSCAVGLNSCLGLFVLYKTIFWFTLKILTRYLWVTLARSMFICKSKIYFWAGGRTLFSWQKKIPEYKTASTYLDSSDPTTKWTKLRVICFGKHTGVINWYPKSLFSSCPTYQLKLSKSAVTNNRQSKIKLIHW